MRVACSSSFTRKPIGEAYAQVAEMGFEFVDLICIPGWNQILPERLASGFEAELGAIGGALNESVLTPVALNAALPQLHNRRDSERNEGRLREMEALCRLMKLLKVPVLSLYPGYLDPSRQWHDILEAMSTTLEELSVVAKRHGVLWGVELHAMTPFENLDQARALMQSCPDLALVYDPSHFSMQGIDLRKTEFLMNRVCHVHFRDAAEGSMHVPLGQGCVDFAWCLDALAAEGYSGDFSIECLPGGDFDAGEDILRLRDLLERAR